MCAWTESGKAEALQHEQELKAKAKEVKATLEQRKAERKDIAAKNRQAGCAHPACCISGAGFVVRLNSMFCV